MMNKRDCEIWERFNNGETVRELSKEYNLSRTYIYNRVVNRKEGLSDFSVDRIKTIKFKALQDYMIENKVNKSKIIDYCMDKTGASRFVINRVLSGELAIDIKVIQEISKYCGIPIEKLFETEGNVE